MTAVWEALAAGCFRALFARLIELLDQAGAKVVVFDWLFAEPDEPVSADLRAATRAATEALGSTRGDGVRATLERFADRDNRFAGAISTSGQVLLPFGFSFVERPGEEPAWLADSAYARFDKSALPTVFPLRPESAVLPIEPLAAASAGFGHTSVAYDRDGAPR